MTPLCHRLRAFPAGELGNEAADKIEKMARELEYLHSKVDQMHGYIDGLNGEVKFWTGKHNALLKRLAEPENVTVNPARIMCLTIETVAQWLETQGLTAVRTVDAQQAARCKATCGAGALGTGDWIDDLIEENGNYYNICGKCFKQFIGHKRRKTCRICALEQKQ